MHAEEKRWHTCDICSKRCTPTGHASVVTGYSITEPCRFSVTCVFQSPTHNGRDICRACFNKYLKMILDESEKIESTKLARGESND